MLRSRSISYGALTSSSLLLVALVAFQVGHISYGGDEIDTGIDVGLQVPLKVKAAAQVPLDGFGELGCPGCQSPTARSPAAEANREVLISTVKNLEEPSSCSSGHDATCGTLKKDTNNAPAAKVRKAVSTDMRIVMEPSYLDWGESPICSMNTAEVELKYNGEQGSAPLRVTSLSTDEIQFYLQDFQAVEVPPGGSTVLKVVYLPRTVGPVDATLVVQTSQGAFLLHMHGQGVMSPYGVTPLSGPKVPFGLQYSYVLMVRNPHKTRLVIREIYTHESFLRLSLLPQHRSEAKDTEGPSSLWVLEPFEEKGVIMLEFKSSVPGKFSGMVTVRMDEVTLMIPVDILAIRGGVHASLEEVDFGTLTFPEEHHRIPVTLLNIGPGAVELLEVVSSSPDPLLGIQYKKGVVLEAGSERAVASVSYTGAAQGRFSGKLHFITNETLHEPPTHFSSLKGVGGMPGNRVELPYKARVLHGSLRYRAENSTFEARKGRSVTRELVLTNHFALPVVIYSATLGDPTSFTVESFPTGHVLAPSGGVAPPLQLRFTANSSDLSFSTQMLVSSNVSMLSIPLHVYHGRLHYSVPAPVAPSNLMQSVGLIGSGGSREKDGPRSVNALDFGVLGVNEARTRSFNISNPNPIGIDISSITTSLKETNLRLDYVLDSLGLPVQLGTNEHLINGRTKGTKHAPGSDKEASGSILGNLLQGLQGLDSKGKGSKKGSKAASLPGPEITVGGNEVVGHIVQEPVVVEGGADTGGIGLDLGPGHTAVFTVELAAEEEERGIGEVVVVTPKERHSIPLLYESIHGSLSIAPAIVRFEGCYPGMVRSVSLMARSAYSRPLQVTAVTFSDSRVRMVFSNTTIPPGNKRVLLGHVEFDAGDWSAMPGQIPVADKSNPFAPDTFDAAAAQVAAMSGHLTKADQAALKARTDAWDSLVEETDGEVRATVTIRTDLVAAYTISIRAGLAKPTILAAPLLNFSVIEVGTSALGVVQVVNPSSTPLSLALLEPVLVPDEASSPQPLHPPGSGFGRSPGNARSGFFESRKPTAVKCDSCSVEDVQGDDAQWCRPKALRSCRLVDDQPAPHDRPPFRLPPGAIKNGVVPPGGSLTLGPVEFSPPSHTRASRAVLHVRNNLTTIEELMLEGRGGSGTLHFLLDHDENDGALRFTIDSALLGLHPDPRWRRTGVLTAKNGLNWPQRVQKRFTAVNVGNMAMKIHSVWLMPLKEFPSGEMPLADMRRECSAGGFELTSCGVLGRTEIPPGESTNIWIQYTPGLSSPFAHSLLVVETSIGRQHFHLHASMPHEALKALHIALAFAPEWDSVRLSAALLVMALTLGATGMVYAEVMEEIYPTKCPTDHPLSGETPSHVDQSAAESREVHTAMGGNKKASLETSSSGSSLQKQSSAASDSSSSTTGGEASNTATTQQKEELGKAGRRKRRNAKLQAEDTKGQAEPCAATKASAAPQARTGDTAETRALMPVTPETRHWQADDDLPLIGEAVPGRRQHLENEQRRVKELQDGPGNSEPLNSMATLKVESAEKWEMATSNGAEDGAAPSTPLSNTQRGSPGKSVESLSLTGSSPCSPPGEDFSASMLANSKAAEDKTAMADAVISKKAEPKKKSFEVPAQPNKEVRTDSAALKAETPSAVTAPQSAVLENSKKDGDKSRGSDKPRAEAPGFKRMAHAKLLTPLETNQQSHLGDIIPATGGKPPQPTQVGQRSQSLEDPSPKTGEAAATPKSARRRRRPRRGGGGNSNPPTPGSGLPAETPTAETPSATPTTTTTAPGMPPLPVDRRSSRRQTPTPADAPHAPIWAQSPSATVPLLPPSPALPPTDTYQHQQPPSLPSSSAHYQQPGGTRPRGISLDQFGPTSRVPESVYSIWGAGGGTSTGSMGPAPGSHLELPGSLVGDPLQQEQQPINSMHTTRLGSAAPSPSTHFQDQFDYAPDFGSSLFSAFPTSSQTFSRAPQPLPQQQTMTMPLHDLLGDDLMAESGLFAPPSDGGNSGSAFSAFSLFSPFLGGRAPPQRPQAPAESNPFMASGDFNAIWAGGPTDPSDPLHWPVEGLSSSREEEQQMPVPDAEQRMWANLD